jgi:glutathione S-transferase-like protein
MKLYVCYGTWKPAPRPGGHPCGQAYHALKDAGYDPEVKRSYGLGALPDSFNNTQGRREVKRLTGNIWVPVLVADDGTVIQGSREIISWAQSNPAPAANPSAAEN